MEPEVIDQHWVNWHKSQREKLLARITSLETRQEEALRQFSLWESGRMDEMGVDTESALVLIASILREA